MVIVEEVLHTVRLQVVLHLDRLRIVALVVLQVLVLIQDQVVQVAAAAVEAQVLQVAVEDADN